MVSPVSQVVPVGACAGYQYMIRIMMLILHKVVVKNELKTGRGLNTAPHSLLIKSAMLEWIV
jgi:hypothetical protein